MKPAVNSGRKVMREPSGSASVYISFWTKKSDPWPTPRTNNSSNSMIGRSMRWKPKRRARLSAAAVIASQ